MQCTPSVQLDDDYETLANGIINLYASINAASYRLIGLIRTFDAASLAQQRGFLSTAHWLGYYLGLGPNAAREKVRVARALVALPQIDAAFEAGRLSYSKVRALTRVAHAANEVRLLYYARNATAQQVERFVRDQVRIRKGRAQLSTPPELNWHTAENGDMVIRARLPKACGALLVAAIEQDLDLLAHPQDPHAADAEPLAVRRAQALVHLAERALTPDAPSGRPQSAADRYLIHLDYDDPDLSEAARQRLSCDAAVVLHDDKRDSEGEISALNVGRKTRIVPAAMRRAIVRRDKGCRFPGCTHKRFVDAHHVKHWAHGGETRLENLILLCRRHHRLVHEGQAQVRAEHPARGAVRFHFYTPEGCRIFVTGDGCLAQAEVTSLTPRDVANVSAVTSAEQSPLAPEYPTTRPDYHEIAHLLGVCEPAENT